MPWNTSPGAIELFCVSDIGFDSPAAESVTLMLTSPGANVVLPELVSFTVIAAPPLLMLAHVSGDSCCVSNFTLAILKFSAPFGTTMVAPFGTGLLGICGDCALAVAAAKSAASAMLRFTKRTDFPATSDIVLFLELS